MNGLMMDFPLTLTHFLKRAETYFGAKEVVTRMPDRSFHRTTWGETLRRARAREASSGARRCRRTA